MLDTLLETSKRAGVAAFFLANPPRAFFSGELQKRLGTKGLGAELSYLVKVGFLTTFTKKGKRYYAVNERSNSYAELRASVLKGAAAYEDELFKFLRKSAGVQYAVLTGIFTGYPDLSCDVLLVGNPTGAELEKFAAGVNELMGQEVNYAVFSPAEFSYRKDTFDRFTKDVFENRHIVAVDKVTR